VWTTGNKIDREDREIPTHVGEDFAQRHGMYFLETSAKEAENVERLFMEIAAELMEVSSWNIYVLSKIKVIQKDFSVGIHYILASTQQGITSIRNEHNLDKR